MAKLTKKQKEAASKIEKNKLYSLKDASSLLKVVASAKFDESVDIAVRLGVDPRKANQMVRGVVSLPHGTGKQVRVLVLCTPDALCCGIREWRLPSAQGHVLWRANH